MGSLILNREPEQATYPAPFAEGEVALGPLRNHVIAFLVCLSLGFVFTLPGSLSPASTLLGYPGDNFQHAWFLWHFARAVRHAQNPFYTDLLFYPHRVNLAWSTTDPVASTLALPLSLAAGAVIAYNLSIVLQLALSAFFARLLCLRISRNEIAALFGGVIFGFSPFFLAHALGHLSLVTAFPIPLFVLVLDRIFRERNASWKYGVLLGLILLLAAMAHYNYVVLCLLLALFWLAIELAANFRSEGFRLLARVRAPLCAAAATFLVGFSPLLWMLAGSASSVPASRGLEHIEQYSADALGFLVPSWNHVFLGRFARGLNPNLFVAGFEGTVYIGVIVLALAAIGFWKGRSFEQRWATRAMVLGLIFYLCSLGPEIRLLGHPRKIPGPAALFYRLPFAQFISAPARFHAGVMLCVAILSSLGVKVLLEKLPKRSRQSLAISLLAIGLMGDYLTIPFPTSSIADAAAPASSGWGSPNAAEGCVLPPRVRHGTVVTFPLVKAPYCMKAMWMQVRDGGQYALADGYLSYAPAQIWKNYGNTPILRSLLSIQGTLRAPVDVAFDRQTVPTAIRDLNLSAIVIFDSPGRDAGSAYVESVFGTKGERAGSCLVFPVGPQPQIAPGQSGGANPPRGFYPSRPVSYRLAPVRGASPGH